MKLEAISSSNKEISQLDQRAVEQREKRRTDYEGHVREQTTDLYSHWHKLHTAKDGEGCSGQCERYYGGVAQ